jgi:hypothetical protein
MYLMISSRYIDCLFFKVDITFNLAPELTSECLEASRYVIETRC